MDRNGVTFHCDVLRVVYFPALNGLSTSYLTWGKGEEKNIDAADTEENDALILRYY
jgi:hypothetical protein